MLEKYVILTSLILAVNVFSVYSDDGQAATTTHDAGDVNAPDSADSLAMYREFYEQNPKSLGSDPGSVRLCPVRSQW